MAKKQETKAQLEKRVKKELQEKSAKELSEKEKRQKAEDNKEIKLTRKQFKDNILLAHNQGIKQGKLELLEKQIKEKDEAEAKPVTLADQLKSLEEKIKYARLQDLEKIQERKIISLINSLAHELEITLRSLLALEERGIIIHISKEDYEKQLKSGKRTSRINSTTRKNLNIIAWSVEQLRVLQSLLGLGKGTQELPLELYPMSKSNHNQEVKRYFKVAERRKKKAEAMFKKQQKDQN